MLHAVFLLVAARQLMLLYHARLVVVLMRTHHKSVLCLLLIAICRQARCLGVDVVTLLLVLSEPPFLAEHCELPCRLVIYLSVVL